jgi:hypothetical protein
MGQSKHAYALANTYDRTATAHRVLGVVFVVDKPQGKLARLPDGTHTHTHTGRERGRQRERESKRERERERERDGSGASAWKAGERTPTDGGGILRPRMETRLAQ